MSSKIGHSASHPFNYSDAVSFYHNTNDCSVQYLSITSQSAADRALSRSRDTGTKKNFTDSVSKYLALKMMMLKMMLPVSHKKD